MVSLVVAAVFALVFGVHANYDAEKGSKLGDMSIAGVSCPVWAVSHNTINLDCEFDASGLKFFIDNTPLTASVGTGELMLTLRQTYAIPYTRSYMLNVKEGNKMLGSLKVPANMLVPKSLVISKLPNFAYDVGSGNITILNAVSFFIPRFNYNGKGPDAFFWVGKGDTPNEHGQIVANELGNKNVLGRYESKDVLIHLPGSLTMHDIDYLSVWCREYKHDFGHVKIPSGLKVPPASYSPQVMDFSVIELKAVPSEITFPDSATSSSSGASTQTKKDKDMMDSGQEGLVAVWLTLFITAVVALLNR